MIDGSKWILIGIMFLYLSACESEAEHQPTTAVVDSVMGVMYSGEKKDTLPRAKPWCTFDEAAFTQQMGKGLATLPYSHFPLVLYHIPDTSTTDTVVLRHASLHIGDVSVTGKPANYLHWVSYPNEYDDGQVIWQDGDPNGYVSLQLNPADQPYWVFMDTSLHMSNRGVYLVSWQRYWDGQAVLLQGNNQQDNPLRKAPTDASTVVPYPDGYSLYSVTAVKRSWVQLNHLLEKEGVYGSDTWSAPVGWMRWYCGGEFRLKVPNSYELEDYYHTEP